jgi:esterase/lipase superfamily enzyme
MKDYRIFYATNRNHIGNDRWHPQSYGKTFSPDGRENLRFGKVTVQADETKVLGYLDEVIRGVGIGNGEGLASYLTEQAKSSSKIEAYPESINPMMPDTKQSRSSFGSNAFFNDLKAVMSNSTDTVAYIHGFNVDWNNAVASAIALQEVLNRRTYGSQPQPATLVLFSWPSDGSMFPFRAYASDRKDAKDSGYAFGRGLLKLRDYFVELRGEVANNKEAKLCGQEIHLLCHSMGNYVLQNALTRMEQFTQTPAMPKLFDHIFMCSADVDDDVLEPGQPMERLDELCRCISVYYNRSDKALIISDKTKGNPERLGTNGAAHPHLLHNKVHQIDCTYAVTGIVEHSYYMNGAVNADIRESIEGFAQDDPRRGRTPTGELPNVWKMKWPGATS